MQINQQVRKIHSPQAAAILSMLYSKSAQAATAPLASIADVWTERATANTAGKLYTPGQVAALENVQQSLLQICKLVDMINFENAAWALGLSTIHAYEASDHIAAVEELIKVIRRTAQNQGVQPVLDNKAGAEHYRAIMQRRETLAAIEAKTTAFYQSRKIQTEQTK